MTDVQTVPDSGRESGQHFFRVGWPAAVFAIYLSAGAFKGDPRLSWFPADLTIVFGVVVFILALIKAALWKPAINTTIVWIVGLYFAFIMSGIYTVWTPYAIDKYSRFITLTLLSSITPFILFDTWEEIRKLINAIICVGIIITFEALEIFVENFGRWIPESRLTASSTNTIELARYAGMVGIYVVLRSAQRSTLQFVASIIAMMAIIVVMLGSGSRGPILGVILSLALSFFIFHRNNPLVVFRLMVFIAVIAVFIPVGVQLLPTRSVQRIEMFFSPDALAQSPDNNSVMLRSNAISVAMDHVQANPLGMGVGGFERITRTRSAAMVYPHNILLELFMENGWFVGGLFLMLVLVTLYRSALAAIAIKTCEAQVVFCLTIFFFINALVSGDLNDNRFLFAFISITLAAFHSRKAMYYSH